MWHLTLFTMFCRHIPDSSACRNGLQYRGAARVWRCAPEILRRRRVARFIHSAVYLLWKIYAAVVSLQ